MAGELLISIKIYFGKNWHRQKPVSTVPVYTTFGRNWPPLL